MRLAYLQLKNYRRFKNLELEFPNGLIGVIGLNGTGKSSLLEAVAWALYGNEKAIVRTDREGVKRQGAAHSDPCEAILEFELNRSTYRIHRKMTGKTLSMSATLLADGKILANGTRETTEAIEKILGMDHKAFFISVFAQQKELNALTTLQPAKRREEILRMLGIQDIDDAIKLLREDKRYADASLKEVRKRLYDDDGKEKIKIIQLELKEFRARDKVEAKIQKDNDKILKKKDEELKETKKKVKSLDEKSKALNIALREKASLKATITSFKQKSKELDVEIKALKESEKEFIKQKGSINKIDKELDGVSEKRNMARKERDEIKANAGELKASIRILGKDISEIDANIKDIEGLGAESECPTCQRKLGATYEKLLTSFGKHRAKFLKEKEEAGKKAEAIEEKMMGLDARMKALDKRERILNEKKREFDKLKAKMERSSDLKKKLEDTNKDLEEKQDKLSKTEKKLKELEFDEASYEKLKASVEKLSIEIRKIERESSQAREKAGRLEVRTSALEKELKELDGLAEGFKAKKKELDLLLKLDEVLGGFKTHMISRIRPGLSQSSSRLISLLTDSRYNEILLNEDYEITMTDESDIHSIDRFSGGEKDLANLCLRLAISQVIAERAGSGGMDFIILDEIFGSQDLSRRNNIFSALAGLSNRFKQIFLITHVEDVKDMLGNAIVVKRLEDGSSTAEVI